MDSTVTGEAAATTPQPQAPLCSWKQPKGPSPTCSPLTNPPTPHQPFRRPEARPSFPGASPTSLVCTPCPKAPKGAILRHPPHVPPPFVATEYSPTISHLVFIHNPLRQARKLPLPKSDFPHLAVKKLKLRKYNSRILGHPALTTNNLQISVA